MKFQNIKSNLKKLRCLDTYNYHYLYSVDSNFIKIIKFANYFEVENS